jgi:hypothetical protein
MKGAGWSMHDKGIASFFFGIRICQSDAGISIDQAPQAKEIVASVLGKDWETKHKPGSKHSIPLPAGTAFEATLVNEVPFDIKALTSAELKYGFKFRSILCGLMHLGLWTRPDVMPSLIRLSRYQSAPVKLTSKPFKPSCCSSVKIPNNASCTGAHTVPLPKCT